LLNGDEIVGVGEELGGISLFRTLLGGRWLWRSLVDTLLRMGGRWRS